MCDKFSYIDHKNDIVKAVYISRNTYYLKYAGTQNGFYLVKRKGKWKGIGEENGCYWNISSSRGVIKDLLAGMDNWVAETILLGNDK